MSDLVERLTGIRATNPGAVGEALAARERRPLLKESGTLFLLAVDHPARGSLKVGDDPTAMPTTDEVNALLAQGGAPRD